jgi:long-chain acyl-CoA synthetase
MRTKFKNYDCLGTKVKNETSGDFEYRWKSYDEIHTDTQIIAHAIIKENLEADVLDSDFNLNIKTVGIVSINREEWLVTDLACNLLDLTSVPLYETLG